MSNDSIGSSSRFLLYCRPNTSGKDYEIISNPGTCPPTPSLASFRSSQSRGELSSRGDNNSRGSLDYEDEIGQMGFNRSVLYSNINVSPAKFIDYKFGISPNSKLDQENRNTYSLKYSPVPAEKSINLNHEDSIAYNEANASLLQDSINNLNLSEQSDDFQGDESVDARAPVRSDNTGSTSNSSDRAFSFEDFKVIDINVGLCTIPNQYCSKLGAQECLKILILKEDKFTWRPNNVMELFSVGKVIGAGNYGKVREAIHRLTGSKIAIKTYDKVTIDSDQSYLARIATEAKILAQLSHPSIVRMFEAIETPKRIHIIMELYTGGNLLTYLKGKKRLGEEESKRIFFAIGQAIDYLHSMGICHKDIKLENVLFTDNKQIKLIDFGFSTDNVRGKKQRPLCGTPSYMAPEVVRRESHEEMPTDIWSLGVLLYAMVAGIFPFRAKTYPELFKKIASGIYFVPEDIGAPCKNLINGMLEMDSNKRMTASAVLHHSWLSTNLLFADDVNKIRKETPILVSDSPADDINRKVLNQIEIFGIPSNEVTNHIINRTRNGITTLYYLLLDYILSGKYNDISNTKRNSQVSDLVDINGANTKTSIESTPDIANPVYDIFNTTPVQQIANPYSQYYQLGSVYYKSEAEAKDDEMNSNQSDKLIQKRPMSSRKMSKIFNNVTNAFKSGSK